MMEDAKGQVGGLESGDAVRRAMASESVGWRCAGCGGRTNREVLGEQEELARKMEEEAVGNGRERKEEEKVPEELKLGYREDIERKDGKTADGAGGGEVGADDADLAQSSLNEVSSPPKASSTHAQPTFEHSERPQDHTLPPAPQPQAATIPASVPVPITTSQAQTATIQPQTTQRQQQQLAPAPTANSWIDLAIVGIAVMLGAMVLRKLLLLNE